MGAYVSSIGDGPGKEMTVVENIFLGAEKARFDHRPDEALQRRELLGRFGLNVPGPDWHASGQQQMVEIAKALRGTEAADG